jgi:hypothetical protein
LFDLKNLVETFLLSVFLVAVLGRKLVFVADTDVVCIADTDVVCIVALKKVERGWHAFVLLLHNSFLEKDVYLLNRESYFG